MKTFSEEAKRCAADTIRQFGGNTYDALVDTIQLYWDADENRKRLLQQYSVSGEFPPSDIALLKRLWTERNPQHETDCDTGEDLFYRTVLCVFADYMHLAGENCR